MRYSDIVPSYELYKELQIGKWSSMESEEPRWNKPQEEAIVRFFDSMPRNASILDAGCGDGFGLGILKKMGFTGSIGMEINPVKVDACKEAGLLVIEEDLHSQPDEAMLFDIIYCSHALEHCYWPGVVVENFYSMLRQFGRLFVILPYPDGGIDEAHGGKYELGTVEEDNFCNVTQFFEDHGFAIDNISRGNRDGGEIRMWMHKNKRHELTDKS